MRMRIVFLFCAVFVLMVGVATATADKGGANAKRKGGNSANAHLCQKGGWIKLQRSDGTKFANHGACVSYGAHGGTIAAIPAPSVSVSYTPTSDPNFCNVTVNLAHFTPSTQYQSGETAPRISGSGASGSRQ